MHELKTLEQLVNYVPLMNVFQDVSSDHSMQVCVHVIKNEIDVPVVLRPDHIQKPYNVLMAVQLLQENNLPERALGIRCVLESVEVFLECHDLLRFFVDGLPDDAVSSFA